MAIPAVTPAEIRLADLIFAVNKQDRSSVRKAAW
jgi:hypothetical protein